MNELTDDDVVSQFTHVWRRKYTSAISLHENEEISLKHFNPTHSSELCLCFNWQNTRKRSICVQEIWGLHSGTEFKHLSYTHEEFERYGTWKHVFRNVENMRHVGWNFKMFFLSGISPKEHVEMKIETVELKKRVEQREIYQRNNVIANCNFSKATHFNKKSQKAKKKKKKSKLFLVCILYYDYEKNIRECNKNSQTQYEYPPDWQLRIIGQFVDTSQFQFRDPKNIVVDSSFIPAVCFSNHSYTDKTVKQKSVESDKIRIKQLREVIKTRKIGEYVKIVKVEAKNLPVMDLGGNCDPFFVLYDSHEKSRVVYTSDIKEQTLNPVWTPSNLLFLKTGAIRELRFRMFDYDIVSKNDKIKGEVTLDVTKLVDGKNVFKKSKNEKWDEVVVYCEMFKGNVYDQFSFISEYNPEIFENESHKLFSYK